MDNLDDMETHFTVFNYESKDKILQMDCDDFIASIEKTYPFLKWQDVQKQINGAMKDCLTAVSRYGLFLSVLRLGTPKFPGKQGVFGFF